MTPRETGGNPTISYGQRVRPYHTVVARLVRKYTAERSSRLLDFGCGVGNTLLAIQRLESDIGMVIADVDERCLEITQRGVSVEMAVHVKGPRDVQELPGGFDVILVSHTLHYDPEPLQTLRALADRVRPGGHLVLASPNPATPVKLLQDVLRRRRSAALYAWDRPALRNLVRLLDGMEIVEVTQDYVPLPLVHKWRLFDAPQVLLSKGLPWLSFSIIVVLRRV